MNGEPKHKITFAGFELDAERRRLMRGGEEVRLNPKAFDVLVYLTENSGRVVSKEEILESVWEGQFVEEANLVVQISTLRKALDDKKDAPRLLATVPGKGYKFVADIETDEELVIENHRFARLIIEEEGEKGGRGEVEKWRRGEEETKKRIPKLSPSPFLLFPPSKTIAVVSLLLVAAVAAIFFWRGATNSAETKPPKITRLTTSGKVSTVAFAPDGRFAVFAQKEAEGESLWLRQIETGSQTRIAAAQKIEYLGLTVSPDGNYVYASIYLENQADTPLWKIPILGGAPEEIPNVVAAAAVSFSPDGKRVAYTESHRPETHLYIADADGANERLLIRAQNDRRFFPFEQVNSVAWSPDGALIAVNFEQKGADGSQAGILLVDPSDASERVLVPPRWAFIDHIAWLDAETLVFTGYEDEWTNQLWTVSRSTGELRQITNTLQKYRWLSTGGGNLLTVQSNTVSGLYTADFTVDAKDLQPREIFRESGQLSWIAWSRSGGIYYSSRATGKSEIWHIESDGSNPSPLTSGANIIYGLAVSPADGRLIFPSHRNGKYTLWTADADGKNMRPLSDAVQPLYPEVAPDGSIVFQASDYQIVRVAADGQAPVQLAKGLKPALSPDGRLTAFFVMDEGKWRITIVATDSGQVVKKLDLPTNVRDRRMRWHPSGKFITIIYSAGEHLNLILLPTDGGAARIVENLGKGKIGSFAWSEDGSRIVYSVTSETQDAVSISDIK